MKGGIILTGKQLKKHLRENPTLIINLLNSLDCHSVKHVKNKRVMAALPDGDNPTSIQIILTDDELGAIIHTRAEYKGGDIFNLISFLKDCNFRNAFMYACKIANVDCTFEYSQPNINKTYNFLKRFNRGSELMEDINDNAILDESVINHYINSPHIKFIKDNLTWQSQIKYKISYDIHDSRILIPIRDVNGNLVTIKGRTVFDDYKDKGIMKYIAYYPYSAKNVLFGYYENYWDILAKNEVIISESEKSVIQADGYGVRNVLAISKSKISDEQLFKIISLNADVVLALDKDVSMNQLEDIANEFKGLCSVYAIVDVNNLLEEHDSPFDKGKSVWDELYKNKIKLL